MLAGRRSIIEQIVLAEGLPSAGDGRWLALGGGSINQCYRLSLAGREYFVKINARQRAAMFTAEKAALAALAECSRLRIPRVVTAGESGDDAYLILEYMCLQPLTTASAAELGRALAALHRMTSEQFGWTIDNTIGSTPQRNTPEACWTVFFTEHRLRPQFEMLIAQGAGDGFASLADELLERAPVLLAGHEPLPSLLHGDLWSGNAAADAQGRAVLFDPASYFGDREADLAMTELFGGFPASFYEAYRECWPLSSGYAQRRQLYNLYHVVNHANLFGGGYRQQAEAMMQALLY